jgi:hypothetical protein
LAVSRQTASENRSRADGQRAGRKPRRGLAAAVGYFVRRPTLVRVAISAAVLFAVVCLYETRQPKRLSSDPTGTEAARQAKPVSAAPAAAVARPEPPVVASPAVRHVAETPTPPSVSGRRGVDSPRDPALDAWVIRSYLRCWTPPSPLPTGEDYAAQIRVTHNLDGSLASAPQLVNPPSDPEWRPYAESAIRAVAKCNPLQIPSRYLANFEQWKKMTLHFAPDHAL